MKKITENLVLTIWEGFAFLFGLLAVCMCFIPAYFENGIPDKSMIDIMMGDSRLGASPLLIVAFIFLIIGLLLSAGLVALLILKKGNEKVTTILSIVSIALTLFGSVVLACAIFVSGLDTINSSLGFTQGNWGIRIGYILVPVFGLLAIVCSYPAAMIILHHKDLEDKARKIAIEQECK